MFYVMTKDGDKIRPFDGIVEYELDMTIGMYSIYCGCTFMGSYKTEEDCLKVIEQLYICIDSGNKIFKFPMGVYK